MTVGIDQTMWYVDVVGLAVTAAVSGRRRAVFLVGVCKYLVQRENRTLGRWLTSWHHLWFIPLVMWVRSAVLVLAATV